MNIMQRILAFFAFIFRAMDPYTWEQEERRQKEMLLADLDCRILDLQTRLYELENCPVLNRDMAARHAGLLARYDVQIHQAQAFRRQVESW